MPARAKVPSLGAKALGKYWQAAFVVPGNYPGSDPRQPEYSSDQELTMELRLEFRPQARAQRKVPNREKASRGSNRCPKALQRSLRTLFSPDPLSARKLKTQPARKGNKREPRFSDKPLSSSCREPVAGRLPLLALPFFEVYRHAFADAFVGWRITAARLPRGQC